MRQDLRDRRPAHRYEPGRSGYSGSRLARRSASPPDAGFHRARIPLGFHGAAPEGFAGRERHPGIRIGRAQGHPALAGDARRAAARQRPGNRRPAGNHPRRHRQKRGGGILAGPLPGAALPPGDQPNRPRHAGYPDHRGENPRQNHVLRRLRYRHDSAVGPAHSDSQRHRLARLSRPGRHPAALPHRRRRRHRQSDRLGQAGGRGRYPPEPGARPLEERGRLFRHRHSGAGRGPSVGHDAAGQARPAYNHDGRGGSASGRRQSAGPRDPEGPRQ